MLALLIHLIITVESTGSRSGSDSSAAADPLGMCERAMQNFFATVCTNRLTEPGIDPSSTCKGIGSRPSFAFCTEAAAKDANFDISKCKAMIEELYPSAASMLQSCSPNDRDLVRHNAVPMTELSVVGLSEVGPRPHYRAYADANLDRRDAGSAGGSETNIPPPPSRFVAIKDWTAKQPVQSQGPSLIRRNAETSAEIQDMMEKGIIQGGAKDRAPKQDRVSTSIHQQSTLSFLLIGCILFALGYLFSTYIERSRKKRAVYLTLLGRAEV